MRLPFSFHSFFRSLLSSNISTTKHQCLSTNRLDKVNILEAIECVVFGTCTLKSFLAAVLSAIRRLPKGLSYEHGRKQIPLLSNTQKTKVPLAVFPRVMQLACAIRERCADFVEVKHCQRRRIFVPKNSIPNNTQFLL